MRPPHYIAAADRQHGFPELIRGSVRAHQRRIQSGVDGHRGCLRARPAPPAATSGAATSWARPPTSAWHREALARAAAASGPCRAVGARSAEVRGEGAAGAQAVEGDAMMRASSHRS